MPLVHSEIQYRNIPLVHGKFVDQGLRHSDICPGNCDPDAMDDEEYRDFLHDNLDEWLDNSNGTGFFYIGEEQALIDNFKSEVVFSDEKHSR